MRKHPFFRSLHLSWRPAAIPRAPIARLLLLEDEEAIRTLLAEALARAGFAVLAGATLEDGLEILNRVGWEGIELVVTDTHLSRQADVRNGYAFHARWRSLYPVPPFVFMDGFGGSRPTGHASCQVYALAKPFDLSVLLSLVRAILGR